MGGDKAILSQALQQGLISGIILAGGVSARFGRPKQLAEIEGKILLQHVIDAACASRLDEVIVVLGHASNVIGRAIHLCVKARAVVNPDYAAGQSTSLQAGLRATHSESKAAAILLADQPRITSDLIDRVIGLAGSSTATGIRPMFQGVPGHPVMIARDAWKKAMEIEGDVGLRSLGSVFRVEDIELGIPPLADVDRIEDIRRLGPDRPSS